MNRTAVWLMIVFLLVSLNALTFGQEISEEAKRHSDYGKAAVRAADYEAAISEFLTATRLAPGWPGAFFNLGLAQEAAKKYKEAAASYREYLRLAPNAGDAEKVKGLINKMDYLAMPVPPIAKGFMGVPWGASMEQVIDFMTGHGYRIKQKTNSFVTFHDPIGEATNQTFYMKKGVFYWAFTMALVRSSYPQVTQATFNRMNNELSGEYGPPQSRDSGVNRDNSGKALPWETLIWTVIDPRTSNKYEIKLEFDVAQYTDTGSSYQYILNIYYTASSLGEKLERE